MVYLIAVCHAIPVLVVWLISHNRSTTIGTAAVMGVIGALTGNPAYIAIDLIAVGLALAYCLSRVDRLSGFHQRPQCTNGTMAPSAQHAAPGQHVADANNSSREQTMGFLSAMRMSSFYDQRIRAYGFEPRSLPPDLHATICSSFERRAQQHADMCRMDGADRSQFVHSAIEAAADLVVLCCVGPSLFKNKGGQLVGETISALVRTALKDGMEGSIELHLVNGINQAGYLNLEFADAFKTERQRQEAVTQKPCAEPIYDATAALRKAQRMQRAIARDVAAAAAAAAAAMTPIGAPDTK